MDEPRRSTADPPALAAVRERLDELVAPVDRTETLPVSTAVGRTLVAAVTARRPVPGFDQAARDGFAVRAGDVESATERDPVALSLAERPDDGTAAGVAPGEGTRVDAGRSVPEGADAVVTLDAVDAPAADLSTVDDAELSVTEPVEPGGAVRSTGADVANGEEVLTAGDRVGPSDPALCTAVGRTRVEVRQRPTVGIVPVGGSLTGGDPGPGEVVETDGTTAAEFVERAGGKVVLRDPVEPERYALRPAVERDLTKDLLVTVGGTGAGESDRIVDVVDGLGDVLVDGVAVEPAGTTALSVVRERPVLSVPGDPVAAFVATTRLVAPAVARLAEREPPEPRTVAAKLGGPVESERGVESVVPVALDASGGDGTETTAVASAVTDEPLSTLARADGWVTVPAERGGLPAGETVSVERWEASV
ncbi:molybdenum cofactor synthesis protein [Halosimplex carlsbadense 2-9-1]|uniref:Molybdenum cofactor synthesis protein n=1 Tax=Halosimplex carlsbadense 2-9-1 TaxID=797114 RepID=M0CNJ0_9EURY|nr:molybdopterin-binding protein [Halosimplex carlsbadense]ELZ24835.1 molybdenum cofactor synthesis protein [Halosimplex carlsbadense 2-9-1]